MKKNIHRFLSLFLAAAMIFSLLPALPTQTFAAETTASNTWAGKKVSILSHSMSTYAGVSNNTNANSTIGSNDVYYTEGKLGVYQKDTWWQQAIDALGMELLVNNSWSGSCVFQPRRGAASVGYGDRAVNLHNDHTGEEPDIIWIYLGCNDFAYYKDTFGKADDVDYATLIQDNGDGTFTYATPTSTCEAYAIMLHKVTTRYTEAEIYCITSTARRDPDYADNYADTGQPTEYSAELHKVARHFSFPVVDLEDCIPKEAALFDQYIGDKRAHCNPLGMDQITNEVLSVMLGKDSEIRHVTSKDGIVKEQAVLLGGSYSAEAELADGYSLAVTMDGKDITAEVCKDGTITIEEVTGDIHVETVIKREPRNFRWEFQDDVLTSVGTSENILTKLSGTVTNNILNDGIFQLNTSVLLKHDLPWAVEWKCAEDWRGAVLVSHEESATKGMTYLTRTKGGQLCFGTYTGSQYDNFGIDISYLDSETHSYRLENRIAEDGSNMVWLYLDGVEIGPMNNYFIGSKDQNATSDWISGKDFVFSFIGMTGHTLRNCQLDYLSVTECDHTYSGTTCTICGAIHPAASDYSGKVISILSASTSTFAGYIPVADGFNLEHRPRYPQDNLLTDVNETWWMQVINDLDAKLGINDSWAGSTVSNFQDTNSGDLGPDAAMASLTRIQNLGANGTPDVILFFGAGNDMGRGVTLGSFDPAIAPTEVDLTATKWDSFADAYVAAIMRLQYFYPDAEIVVMTTYAMPSYVTTAKLDKYGPVIKAICDHYGVKYVDLQDCGVTFDMLPDNVHPNAEGMDYITADVLDTLLNQVEMESGENVVYPVTHDLTNAGASLHYYKGVSAGESFVETVSGENLTVTVTMGGVDITAHVYVNGTISIPSVTSELVITVKGTFDADGHLQQLPDELCAGTNLWTALTPENIYYTATGWGNTSAGTTWSITFPVMPGERIWATSLGAAPDNGSTANGVRITWFDENGMMATLDRNMVYQEFAQYGYITVPEGAVALNLPMTDNQSHYAVYILSAEHNFVDDVCTICGIQHTNPELEGHLQQLPENICAGTNLWTTLTPENTYYLGTEWGLYTSSPNVHSVTFPVTPGDQLWATSFGPGSTSGDKTGNGTRITWFDEDGVLESVSRDVVYKEFLQNGYITVPEGAIAVNIPMPTGADTWELYILNLPHTPGEAVTENEGAHGSHDLVVYCEICGEELGREHDDGYLPGDINGDGVVNNKDITRLFQYLSDYNVEVVEEALDVNGDGQINNKDLTRLFQYLSDYDVELH